MKHIFSFLGGMVVGGLLYGGIMEYQERQIVEESVEQTADANATPFQQPVTKDPNLQFFKTPGDCITTYKYEVEEVYKPGYALAQELESEFGFDIPTYRYALIYDPHKKPFYDGQIIVIPKGYCARHIGTYKHGYGGTETAPIVQIMKK